MRKTIFVALTFAITSLSVKAHKDKPPNLYQFYQTIFDKKDTVKLRNLTVGSCYYESLYQLIKKDDSTIIVNKISTPCLDREKPQLPDLEEFDYMPYSIEVPLSVLNFVNFNLQDVTGRLRIIDLRRDLSTHVLKKYSPYVDYNMNFIEFIEFAKETNKEYGIYDRIVDEMRDEDLFSDYNRQSYGQNPTFYLEHMWGVRITENFIVLIENVQNGLFIHDVKEKDYTTVFIRMAESIKPINPNVFNLNDLSNYK